MRAIFYIDGFNLYFLRLRDNPQFKWLNIAALANALVPNGTSVEKVKYYTASVSGKLDQTAPQRQQAYLNALRTEPQVEVFLSRFLASQKWAGLVQPPRAKPDNYVWNLPVPEVVYVNRMEEKGSDVNLGVHLVRDGFVDAFDVAYVITNDTDLVEPIRIVKEEIGKPVVIVAPCRPRNAKTPVPAPSLLKVATSHVYLDDVDLAASQFPSPLPRPGKKPLTRPATWA